MDVFIEEMVERKVGIGNILIFFGLLLLCVIISFLLLFVLGGMIPQLGGIILLLVVGVFYVAYRIATAQNVEFEYSMVNTEIDVDKIMNRRNRKRLTTANIKGLEAFGVAGKEKGKYEKNISDVSVKKIYACRDKKSADNYFIVYFEDSVKTMLVFNPSDKIVSMIEKFNPKRV